MTDEYSTMKKTDRTDRARIDRDTSPVLLSKKIIYQIGFGLSCAVRGFVYSWNNPCSFDWNRFSRWNKRKIFFWSFVFLWQDVWSTQKRSFISLVVCTIVVYLLTIICFLPIRFIVWICSLIFQFSPEDIEWLENLTSARALLFHLLSFIPLLAVYVTNTILGRKSIWTFFSRFTSLIDRSIDRIGYDKLFFSVLASANPSLTELLNTRARQTFTSSLYYFVRRFLTIFSFLIALHFLRLLPFFGQFVPAIWVFQYARYTVANTKNVYLRSAFFLVLVVLTIFKSFHERILWVLKIQMASTALARELFDSYLSRIHTETISNHRSVSIKTYETPTRFRFLGFTLPHSVQKYFQLDKNSFQTRPINHIDLPHKKISHFLRENYFLLLAFAFPYVFLFSVPILGFFCVGFAHGAAAFTLALLTRWNRFDFCELQIRMDRQEFFQSYMDHWGIADVLLDCYVDLLTMETVNNNRFIDFKRLLAEHHILCKEHQLCRQEIDFLREQLQQLKSNSNN